MSSSAPARRSRWPGPIPTLGAFFLASALLRVMGGIPEVMAAGGETPVAPQPDPPHTQAALCVDDAELQRILDAVRAREAAVAETEAALEKQAAQIAADRQDADARTEEARRAEADLKATMATADAASETDLAQLTQVYQRMKPKQAAALFEAMAPQFSAGFLARMSAESAAGILAAMTPEAAYSVSVILAGRNADAGIPGQATEPATAGH